MSLKTFFFVCTINQNLVWVENLNTYKHTLVSWLQLSGNCLTSKSKNDESAYHNATVASAWTFTVKTKMLAGGCSCIFYPIISSGWGHADHSRFTCPTWGWKTILLQILNNNSFTSSYLTVEACITVQGWSSWTPGTGSLSQKPARNGRNQRSSMSLCLCSVWSKTPNSSSQSPRRSVCAQFTCLFVHICAKPMESKATLSLCL